MDVAEEIIAARTYGTVRCGLSSRPSPTILELAREFGLREEAACQEIGEAAAGGLIRTVLHRDMAYDDELMPDTRAAELADRFLAIFGPGTRYFSNGAWRLRSDRRPGEVWCRGLEPATPATLDTRVLAVGPERSGCLWVEDED